MQSFEILQASNRKTRYRIGATVSLFAERCLRYSAPLWYGCDESSEQSSCVLRFVKRTIIGDWRLFSILLPISEILSSEKGMNEICRTCRNLDAACQVEERKSNKIGDNRQSPRVLFSIRKEDIRISSEAGCHFCSVLLRVLSHLPQQWVSSDRGSFQLDPSASVRASFSQSSLSLSSFRKHEFEIYAPEGEKQLYSAPTTKIC